VSDGPTRALEPVPPPIVIGYIEASHWRFARSMPSNPHWYVVRPKGPGPELAAHLAFCRWLTAEGRDRTWHGRPFRTASWDGWDYWHMGDDTVINRKPTGQAGWDDEASTGRWLEESDHGGIDPDSGIEP
jgi:hypothetical protein